MRDKYGRFVKGHKFIKGGEKGWFKKGQTVGHKNASWKGGEIKKNDYIYTYMPKHPFAIKAGYIKRANLVMEKIIGRYLEPEEVVHHKGVKYPFGSIENKQDDSPENLQLFSNSSAHQKFHHFLRKF